MKHRLLLIIFLFTAFCGFAQELRQMQLLGKAEKLTNEIASRRDRDGNWAAAIQVISDMDGFSYDAFNGVVGNVDSRPGMDIVYLQTTERVLEVYRTGYEPLRLILSELGIRLQAREVWRIRISGDEPAAQSLQVIIRIDPPDASLHINNQAVSNTGTHALAIGEHRLRIAKADYKTIETTISVDEQNILFEYTLERQPDAGLQIETTPDGATVYLDGINLGESPVAVFYKPGTYPIRIVKDGYVTLENQTLEVKLPNTRQSYTLEENVGYLTINTFGGATVFFNEQRINNPKNVKLAPQLVRVRVSMPKAESLEQQVVLRRNDRLTLDMYPDVQTGTIQVAVTPFDAKIELTGDAGEKYGAEGMKVFEDIPVGTYTIKVSAAGHEPKEETVVLKSGERESRSVRLVEAKAAQAPVPESRQVAAQNKDLKIGDRAHGGIVFYLDGKGGGLVCAEEDQGRAKWGCHGTSIRGTQTGIGSGAANTAKIVAGCSEAGAARICNDLVLNGYSDWFLPSKDELNLMYQNLHLNGIGGFAVSYYWSSSEVSTYYAWIQYFFNGGQYSFNKYNYDRVRAVRAF